MKNELNIFQRLWLIFRIIFSGKNKYLIMISQALASYNFDSEYSNPEVDMANCQILSQVVRTFDKQGNFCLVYLPQDIFTFRIYRYFAVKLGPENYMSKINEVNGLIRDMIDLEARSDFSCFSPKYRNSVVKLIDKMLILAHQEINTESRIELFRKFCFSSFQADILKKFLT